jgi:hypothetical protein
LPIIFLGFSGQCSAEIMMLGTSLDIQQLSAVDTYAYQIYIYKTGHNQSAHWILIAESIISLK